MIKQLGRYRITKLIAAGGMARVFHCEDVKGELTNLAAKIPMDFVLSQPQYLKRFENEGKISMKFKHPNIIRVHDAGTFEGTPYMVMDFIDGKSLEDIEKERGIIPLKESLQIIKELCKAIAYMHNYRDEDITSSIVHRDLSPQNTVIRKDGRVLLMDFGIAKSASLTSVTMGTATIGKPYYMAPEQIQAKNSDAIDKRADIYAVGVILYEMLTGKKPYEGTNPFQVMEKVRNPKILPTPPHEIDPSIPKGISEIIMRAMHKSRGQRFQHIEEMLKALEKGEDTSEAKRMTRVMAMLGTLSALMISLGVGGLVYTDRLDFDRRLSMSLSSVPARVRAERIPLAGETLPQHRIRLTSGSRAFETLSDDQGFFRFEEIPLLQGDNVLRLALYDTAGNLIHKKADPISVRFDRIPPSQPALDLFPPILGAGPHKFSGRAEEGTTVSAICSIEGSEKNACHTRADSEGRFEMELKLPEGASEWTLFCTDPAGNTSEAMALELISDTNAPAAPELLTPPSPAPPGPLSLFGTAEPYSRVAMTAGATNLTAEADSLGVFAFQNINLAAGDYTVNLQALDRAGNRSPMAPPFLLKVQEGAAVLPFPILTGTDFSQASLPFTGNCKPGAQVNLEINGIRQSLAGDEKGRFNTTLTLKPGSNDISLDSGQEGNSVRLRLVLDQTSPEAPRIWSPRPFTFSSQYLLTGRAEPFTNLELKTPWGEFNARTEADGLFSIPVRDIPEGLSVLSLTAIDRAGNISEALAIDLVRDTQAPILELTPPESLIRFETISLEGRTEPGAMVRARVAGRWQGISSDEEGFFYLPGLGLKIGSNVIELTSTDLAGNVTLFGETLEINVDITPPGQPRLEAIPNRLNSTRAVTIKGVSEPDSKVLAVVLCPNLKRGNGETNGKDELQEYRRIQVATDEKGGFTIENLKLNVGENQIRVTALDLAGNESLPAPMAVVMVDLALPPSPEFVDFPEFTSMTHFSMKARTQPGMAVRALANGVSVEASSDSAGLALLAGLPLNEGRNRIEILAIDESGLESPECFREVTLDLVKPSPPEITEVPARVDKPSLTVDGRAEADCSVILDVNGASFETSPDQDGNFKFLGIRLKEGINRIIPTARDKAGNISDPGSILKVVLDTIPPDPPKLVNIPNIVEAEELSVAGLAESGSRVSILVNEESTDVNVGSSGNFTVTIRLREGQNTITATARDEVGNESNLSETFQVTCSIPPDPPVFKDLPVVVTNPVLELSGMAEKGSTVKIHVSDKVIEVQCDTGQFSSRIDLVSGSNLIWAEAVDSFGNSSKPTRTFDVSYEKVAFMDIETLPAGALVMIGQERLGTTPVKGAKVPPGPISIELRKEGYRTRILEKNYQIGETESLSLELEQLTLPMTIDSDPPGADLYLDGSLLGKTPYKAEAVPAGTHQVVLRLANHLDRSERIELSEGGQSTFTFDIQPILGQLILDCEVEGAKVFVNNQQVGETPLGKIDLPYGQHMILIQKTGYAAFKRKVTIESPVEVEVKALLSKLQYKIEIVCSEEGAKVYRDGQMIGKTPLPPFEVPDVGEYSIKIEKDGFRPFFGKVDIFETGITPKNVRLIRAQALVVERDDKKDRGQSRLTYDDKNNDFWLAKTISLDREFSDVLELSKGDSVDWWKVTFDNSGYLYLTLEGEASMQLFRDDQANQLQVSGKSASRIQMDSGSTLYLKIMGDGDKDVNYKLLPSFRAHSTGDGF